MPALRVQWSTVRIFAIVFLVLMITLAPGQYIVIQSFDWPISYGWTGFVPQPVARNTSRDWRIVSHNSTGRTQWLVWSHQWFQLNDAFVWAAGATTTRRLLRPADELEMPSIVRSEFLNMASSDSDVQVLSIKASGFPFLSLYTIDRLAGVRVASVVRFDWIAHSVNAVIWTVILIVVVMGVLRAVRSAVFRLRASHGYCPRCAFDLRHVDNGVAAGCPECGWNRPPNEGRRPTEQPPSSEPSSTPPSVSTPTSAPPSPPESTGSGDAPAPM